MVNGRTTSPTAFPEFPSLFTPKDTKRLRELEEQRRQLDVALQSKFNREAWASLPAPERWVRRLLPPIVAPAVGALAPEQLGLDFGFTPEQVQERSFEIEEEFKELVRRQRVSRLLTPIKDTLRALAFTDDIITDAAELRTIFKLKELGFNEDDMSFITDFAQRVLKASPEELASGEIFELEPLTPEEVDELARTAREPRQVLTTVALSKSLEDFTAALQSLYAPKEDTSVRRKAIDDFVEQIKASGITKESSEEVFRQIAEEEGETLILTDEATGGMVPVSKKSDNTVWSEDELIGFWSIGQGQIVPIGLSTGQPLETEEAQDSQLKDLWNSFYLGLHQAWNGTRQGLLIALKDAMTPSALEGVEGLEGNEGFPGQRSLYKGLVESLEQKQEIRDLEFQEWMKEHPELVPKPEYTQSPFEHPELLKDPFYYAHVIVSNAPIMATALGVGIATTLATKNPLAGAIAGAAVITPVQINSVYDDLIANGADPINAAEMATGVGTLMGAVEILPGMVVLKAVSPAFMRVFRKNLQKELTRQVTKRMIARGILATAGKVEIAETLEEIIQESMQNAAVQTVNENRELFENIPQVAIEAAIATLPLAAFGGGANYVAMKQHLPPATQKKIDKTATEMKEAGLEDDHAEAVAVTKMMETETGQAEVELAVEKADAEIPTGTVEFIGRVSPDTFEGRSIFEMTPEELDIAAKQVAEEERNISATILGGELGARYDKLLRQADSSNIPRAEAADKQIAEIESQLTSKQIDRLGGVGEPGANAEELAELRDDLNAIDIESEQAMGESLRFIITKLPDHTDVSKMTAVEKGAVAVLRHANRLAQERGFDTAKVTNIAIGASAARFGEDAEFMLRRVRQLASVKLEAPQPTPPTDVIATKVSNLTNKLDAINQDIAVFKSSIEAQEERLSKLTLPQEQAELTSTVEGLKETLAELEKQKAKTQKNLDKLNKSSIVIPEDAPITHIGIEPEGIRIADELGLRYEGILPLAPDKFHFTDVRQTGTSFPIPENTLESAKTELTRIRKTFGEPVEPTPSPDESLSALDPEEASPFTEVRRPRQQDWEDERVGVEAAEANPNIARNLKVKKAVVEFRKQAKDNLDALKELQGRLEGEELEAVEKQLKDLAVEAGLGRKELLAQGWDDLPPSDQQSLTVASIPRGSLKMSGVTEFADIEYYLEFLEELTGLPFYSVARRVEASAAIAEITKERALILLTNDPAFAQIKKDSAALERVGQELNARNEVQGIEHPANMTEEELLMVDTIQEIYEEYKPKVRYLRVMDTESTLEEFQKEFPDAVEAGNEAELVIAMELKEQENFDALWQFLLPLDWGVINTGFDPRFIAASHIAPPRRRLKSTRGKGRMIRRTAVEYPTDKISINNPLIRVGVYLEQMEIQWQVAPEINKFGDLWQEVWDKFENHGNIEQGLQEWLNRVQGIGLHFSWFDKLVRRTWRQSMSAIFIEPVLSLRNSLQAGLFHPDRTELLRVNIQRLPEALAAKSQLYFDTFVSQLGGLRKDYLHTGQPGLVPDVWNRVSDALSLYGKSDYFPRLWSFKASLNKARRATEQYRKDGDIPKWIKNSGAIHLRNTEKNHVLTHFLGQLDNTFDLGVEGLREISGADMASMYVAQRMADITHFKYRRSARGIIEMGVTGETLWNLVVFTRGYSQRLYFQAAKIRDTFKGEADWNEARTGFNDIMKLVVASLIIDQLYLTATGRKRNPYFILNILFGWQFGGLFIGIAQDVFKFINDVIEVGNPLTDEETRKFAWGRLTQEPVRVADSLIPLYRRTMDALDLAYSTTNLDKHWLKQIRAQFDKDYTPDELEELDRSFWQIVQKGLLGSEMPDPTVLQAMQTNLQESEDKLGTQDTIGRFHTLRQFGDNIKSLTKPIPDNLMTEDDGYSPLVMFYKESEANWREFNELPTTTKVREEWRKEHILEEAMLLFWGRASRSVFEEGSTQWEEVSELISTWFSLYNIKPTQHPHYADWTRVPLGGLTPPE